MSKAQRSNDLGHRTHVLLERSLQLASCGLAEDVDPEKRLIGEGDHGHGGLDHQRLQKALPHM